MKASRKGTRLNDAFYFRQPLPHLRTMMTAMCLMPQVSNMQLNYHFAPERLLHDPNFPTSSRPREQNKKLDVRQSSIEMARTPWNTSWTHNRDKILDNNHFHSTSAETDLELLKESEPKLSEHKMAAVDLLPEVEEVLRVIEPVESMLKCDVKKLGEDIWMENEEKKPQKKPFSWWREINVGQAIYHLFTHFFARRQAAPGKHRTKRAATKCRMHDVGNDSVEVVMKVAKNDRMHQNRSPCTVNDCSRSADGKSDDKAVSMLVRQIERTRDKNLRVTLLERELRTRICAQGTRKSGFQCKMEERHAARQMSSPLC